MPHLHIVVLAAGQGTRMKSSRAKVLHHVAGRPMIAHVLDVARSLAPASITVVVGHQASTVAAALADQPDLTFVVQQPQLGTGHALLTAASALERASGNIVLLSGDVPLLTANTLRLLLDRHEAASAAATVLTAIVDQPHGYGRIVRSGDQIAGIVEERDATDDERKICEINSGIYAFALDGLFDAVRSIGSENAQREYYLPDLVSIYQTRGLRVASLVAAHADEIRGVNSRVELAEVSRIVRRRKNISLMTAGVTIEDPATTYVDETVKIGIDTVLHPGVSIEGSTVIGAGCEIHSGVRLVNAHLGQRVTILDHCLISDSSVADDGRVGPFAHLRNGSGVAEGARVGNFVELKKTALGAGSKAMHLTYLGDATLGRKVNIGAGTITCNYDGAQKRQTTIEDGAFVGSDTQLIAPVTVHRNAYVGTGTTVREDVPEGALAVSAGKQRNIEGWVDKKKGRKVET